MTAQPTVTYDRRRGDRPTDRLDWDGRDGRADGRSLACRGYEVDVFNRTRERTADLIGSGARWRDSPRELAAQSEVVFLMLGYPSDVRNTVLGEGGVLHAMKPGSLLIDMTTSEPSLAVKIQAAAAAQGVEALDAPVSGGDVGARNATLVIMVGGSVEAFDRALPLFEALGQTIRHLGPPGAGQHTKMVNQVLIATNMIGVCEALLYGYKAGLDLKTVLQTVGGGAAASWSLNNLGPRIIDRNFEPGFFVEHFIKDMGIALDEARRMGLSLPGLALANQLYLAVKAQGWGRKGTHALMLALEQLSGIKR